MPAANVRGQGSVKILANIKSEVLYFLAPRQPDFVNSIVQIMEDDGPRPMRNMRPAQKQRTGAEKFQSDHHGQYEARGRQSRDEVGRVHAHNNAYPKLYDELDNRRTTAKPSMRIDHSSYHRAMGHKPLCCRCLRLKNKEAHQIKRYKSPNKRFRSYKMKSRITKPKQKFTKKYPTRSRNIKPKFNLNKGCQYYRVPVETKSVSTYDDDYAEDNMPGTSKNQESNHKSQEDPKELKNGDSTISIPGPPKSEHSQNPGTSAPSLSSYNSYLSIDHEPMVD